MTDEAPAVAPVATDDTNSDAVVDDTTVVTNSDGVADAAAVDGAAGGDDATGGEGSDEGGQGVPDTYADFTMPEGMPVDTALLEAAAPVFKDLGLSQEQAQKLVDFQASRVQAGLANDVDAFEQMIGGWKTDARNDSEFGGDKYDESTSIAAAAVEKFGTPEFKRLLNDHGVGDHPEMIRFMLKVGRLTKEDVPGGTSAPQSRESSRVNDLYPDAKQA